MPTLQPICYVIGIDPSLCSTGVVVLSSNGELAASALVKSKPPESQGVAARILRVTQIAMMVQDLIVDYLPVVVCIEGYSMGSNQSGHSAIIECGYELRRMICGKTNARLIEVAPAALKKFCMGSGNGDKSAVASALTHRYGVLFESSDAADAYGLARMALQIGGYEESATQQQREAVATASGVKVKKVRKPRAKG